VLEVDPHPPRGQFDDAADTPFEIRLMANKVPDLDDVILARRVSCAAVLSS
jgi:hypothetical protein